jgi:hypothetical protein
MAAPSKKARTVALNRIAAATVGYIFSLHFQN